MKLERFYRIQGGKPPNASREMLLVNNNRLEINTNKVLQNIHIGNIEHMRYFLNIRLGKKLNEPMNLHEDLSNKGVEIITMYFPTFFKTMLEENVAPQFISSKNDPYAPPQLVDYLSPGDSYAIKGVWNLIMKECCLHATKQKIRNREDMLKAFGEEEIDDDFCDINTTLLKSLLRKARVQNSEEYINDARIINEKKEKGHSI